MGSGSSSTRAEPLARPLHPSGVRPFHLDNGRVFINGGDFLQSKYNISETDRQAVAALNQGGVVYIPDTSIGITGDKSVNGSEEEGSSPSESAGEAPPVHVVQASFPTGDVYFVENQAI